MLETNTDRSYMTIAAMIIAGLLIITAVAVFSLLTVDGWAYNEMEAWLVSAKTAMDSTLSKLGS